MSEGCNLCSTHGVLLFPAPVVQTYPELCFDTIAVRTLESRLCYQLHHPHLHENCIHDKAGAPYPWGPTFLADVPQVSLSLLPHLCVTVHQLFWGWLLSCFHVDYQALLTAFPETRLPPRRGQWSPFRKG